MKCECCKTKEAVVIDFRQRYEVGCLSKYRVCYDCLHRTDRSFFAKLEAKTKVK